jgi:hypothetical protein
MKPRLPPIEIQEYLREAGPPKGHKPKGPEYSANKKQAKIRRYHLTGEWDEADGPKPKAKSSKPTKKKESFTETYERVLREGYSDEYLSEDEIYSNFKVGVLDAEDAINMLVEEYGYNSSDAVVFLGIDELEESLVDGFIRLREGGHRVSLDPEVKSNFIHGILLIKDPQKRREVMAEIQKEVYDANVKDYLKQNPQESQASAEANENTKQAQADLGAK